MVRAVQRVSLGDFQLVAVLVASAVEPSEPDEAGDFYDERVALPVAVRPAHVALDRRLDVLAHVHDAVRARELVGEEDVVDALHDAKRIGEVRRARNAGLIALRFRVARRPLRPVLRALRERFRKVWDLTADDYAAAGGDRADRPEPRELGQRLRGMTFEIPVRRAEGLPDPVEIRAAFDALGLRLRTCARREPERQEGGC